MNIFSFEQFLTESLKLQFSFFDEKGKEVVPKDFRKVQFIADSYNVQSEYTFKFIACHSLFTLISADNIAELDPSLPSVNFAQNSFVQNLIDTKKLDPKRLYNKPAQKMISARKKDFHKLFLGADFLPKTAFSVEEAKALKFPIVAKPSRGHSGIGITKFSSHKELKSSKEKFDIFCEAISIDKEVRLVYLKDELISFMVREPRDEKSKFLQGKVKTMGDLKAKDKLDFVYHIHLPEELSSKPDFFFSGVDKMQELKKVLAEIRKKVPLEFLTLDVAIDEDGKIWVLEINTEPGSIGVMLANLYDAIFRDFYGRPMEKESQKFMQDVEMKLINFTLKKDKFQLSGKFVDKYIK